MKEEGRRQMEVETVIEMIVKIGERERKREIHYHLVKRRQRERKLKPFSSPLEYAVALLHFSARNS